MKKGKEKSDQDGQDKAEERIRDRIVAMRLVKKRKKEERKLIFRY